MDLYWHICTERPLTYIGKFGQSKESLQKELVVINSLRWQPAFVEECSKVASAFSSNARDDRRRETTYMGFVFFIR